MNNFTQNVGHMAMAIVIIVCVTILAIHGTITGSDALVLIAGLGGVSVGGSVASSLAGGSVPVSGVVSSSPGGSGSASTTTATVAPVTIPVQVEVTPTTTTLAGSGASPAAATPTTTDPGKVV